MLKRSFAKSLSKLQNKAREEEIDSLLEETCTKLSLDLQPSIIDGSDKETKSRTIPSALGRNFSSRVDTTSIPDLIGRKTKKPTFWIARRLNVFF